VGAVQHLLVFPHLGHQGEDRQGNVVRQHCDQQHASYRGPIRIPKLPISRKVEIAMIRLTLATPEENAVASKAKVFGPIPNDLKYLVKDPLAVLERGRPQGYDHIHLSVPDTDPNLVQWWGRGSTGYHYPIGQVMKMIDDN
jgi:hypothetical protein